ncbi:MAG: aspartyl/asparaginyl beta-hydroxylase domain-containing protein [Chitinophagaceae bacterium]|nr:aspartyl/asparaginyl beta-hydroxylase domain-containing protein [Chitinophagaceae bacterium]
MIKYLQLNQQFDVQQMQQEVALLENGLWKAHYNTTHYEGSWTILPLRSINGSIDNIISIHSAAATSIPAYQNTALLEQCRYIQSVLDWFECEKTAVRLMKLHAGAVIKEHSDHDLCFEDGEVRLHIPVITNNAVDFFLDDERIPMQEGECWYMNLTLKHRINNYSNIDRVHLVLDCKVNDWIKEQFVTNTLLRTDVAVEQMTKQSNEEKQKIIAQLRLLNTSTAHELADKMEKETE